MELAGGLVEARCGRCWNGPTCWHLWAGTCRFHHSHAERQQAANCPDAPGSVPSQREHRPRAYRHTVLHQQDPERFHDCNAEEEAQAAVMSNDEDELRELKELCLTTSARADKLERTVSQLSEWQMDVKSQLSSYEVLPQDVFDLRQRHQTLAAESMRITPPGLDDELTAKLLNMGKDLTGLKSFQQQLQKVNWSKIAASVDRMEADKFGMKSELNAMQQHMQELECATAATSVDHDSALADIRRLIAVTKDTDTSVAAGAGSVGGRLRLQEELWETFVSKQALENDRVQDALTSLQETQQRCMEGVSQLRLDLDVAFANRRKVSGPTDGQENVTMAPLQVHDQAQNTQSTQLEGGKGQHRLDADRPQQTIHGQGSGCQTNAKPPQPPRRQEHPATAAETAPGKEKIVQTADSANTSDERCGRGEGEAHTIADAGLAAQPETSEDMPRPAEDTRTADEIALSNEYKECIADIYRSRNPDKLAVLDDLMAKYRGREHIMYEKVCRIYDQPVMGIDGMMVMCKIKRDRLPAEG